jgi:Ca-activated chloride channel family protein
MTDGYVGNDMEIISEVKKHPNARVFAFGIGGSVNRFLLDKMAEHGRGEVEYVTLSDDGSAAARRFHERVRSPLLTDISIDWSGLPVTDVYPARIPDLFSAKPVVLTGRYTAGARGVIKLKGRVSGRDFVRDIPVDLSDNESRNGVLASLWARTRIDDLMSQDYNGIQNGAPRDDIRESITRLGLDFRLMTQFTSFVAVEEMTVTDGGEPRRIEVPVELPEGVSRSGLVGRDQPFEKLQLMAGSSETVMVTSATVAVLPASPRSAQKRESKDGKRGGLQSGPGSGGGMGDGRGAGAGSGITADRVSAEEQRHRELLSKVNPAIAAVIDRLKNKGQPSADETRFVRNGKAEIQVWLTVKSPETIAQLKQIGFEVVLDPKTAKMIIGRLPIEKLAALAELKSVRYVTPMTGN